MNNGAICSTDWPLDNKNAPSMNLPECGRFSPFSSSSIACLIHGGYSPVVTVKVINFFDSETSLVTESSKPEIIVGVFALIIFELMYVPNSFLINLTVSCGVRKTCPFSTCLLISFHSLS